MNKLKIYLILIFLIGSVLNIFPQQTFRRAVYLSQSFGSHLYNHSLVGSPGTTTVPNEVAIYNSAHGYTGNNAFTINRITPDYPLVGDMIWQWNQVFFGGSLYSNTQNVITEYAIPNTYDIINVTIGFNSGDIWFPDWYVDETDTLHYPLSHIENVYKYWIRQMVATMELYPDKYWILWNIPPVTVGSSGGSADALRHANFNNWMVNTLQAGLDIYGTFPKNVYIFDIFSLLKNTSNNFMNLAYADGLEDSHPNALASSLVAPILVQQMFDAAIAYEQYISFRSGVFLHHSTGANIWSQEGTNINIPQQINLYNSNHGYTGINNYSMNEVWFPGSGAGNDWFNWHWIFDNIDEYGNNIYPYLETNKIVVIKSCFPSSDMVGYGSSADTIGASVNNKTIYNYKWHLRSIIKKMENRPENFFAIWTNAPLVQEVTNSMAARLSHEFTTWMKDTLATGLDPIYGAFPPNIYIFDFFHKLTNSNHYMNPTYQRQYEDSHPNATATALIAPQFVNEIFDAARAYEENLLPVELTSFSATIIGSTIKLSWNTATETNNYGFDIERNINSEWKRIGFVEGNGNSNSTKEYSFTDYKTINASEFKYRLKQIDNDGQFEFSNILSVKFAITNFELYQNYPNPFNPSTKISFALPEAGNVKLTVFNILGQEIRTLVNEVKEAGTHTINLNASDLNSGVYIYKIESGSFTQTKKMTLVK